MSNYKDYIAECEARMNDPNLPGKYVRLEWRAIAMAAALTKCAEYFDQRADADMRNNMYFAPNEEMRLLQIVRDALGGAK
jgi:hypothetical protein